MHASTTTTLMHSYANTQRQRCTQQGFVRFRYEQIWNTIRRNRVCFNSSRFPSLRPNTYRVWRDTKYTYHCAEDELLSLLLNIPLHLSELREPLYLPFFLHSYKYMYRGGEWAESGSSFQRQAPSRDPSGRNSLGEEVCTHTIDARRTHNTS